MMRPPKILNSVLIKPAGPDCNMACSYCFYLEKADLFHEKSIHRMTDEILHQTVKQVMENGAHQVSFGWQGGEPTLMGIDFFKKAVSFQRQFGQPGQIVGNGLQTNGILINKEWAQFLSESKFLVGLSLDGPQHIHDKYRRLRGGQSSWEKVARARDVMLNHGVEVNALIVVNDYSVKFAHEIYEYHKQNGLSFMQFIPCVEPDPLEPTRAAAYSVSGNDFGKFLCELFDLWMADFQYGEPTTSIRWFDSIFYTYVGLQAPECTLFPECGIYVVVEHNGNVYSCDFFVEPKWYLGNIRTQNLKEMLNSDLQYEFGQVKSNRPPECNECPWLAHCWGGCPKDRQGDPRDRNSNHFCESFKLFFEYADQRLRRLADKWIQEQMAQQAQLRAQQLKQQKFTEVDRNDPCPCGSGKKFKKCCGQFL